MEFILWLVFAMAFAWCVLNPFKVIAIARDGFKYYAAKLITQDKQSKIKKAPQPDYIPKNRKDEARKHQEWDYAFAVLQIQTKRK